MIMKFTCLSIDEYTAYLDQYKDANFWQSSEMISMRERKGWQIHYVGIKEEQQIVGAAALHAKRVFLQENLFMSLRGFLIDYENLPLLQCFLSGLTTYLQEHHCLYLKVDPYVSYQPHQSDGSIPEGSKKADEIVNLFLSNGFVHQGFDIGMRDTSEPRWMSVLPLEHQTEETLLQKMNVTTRQNIHQMLKLGVKVEELQKENVSVLYEIISETGNRRHFKSPPLSYYEQFLDCFQEHAKALIAYLDLKDYQLRLHQQLNEEQKKQKLVMAALEEHPSSKRNIKRLQIAHQQIASLIQRVEEAKQLQAIFGDKLILAGALFVIYPMEIVYLFSGSKEALKRFKGPYALQWYMIGYALQHQIRRYNFYGISGEFQEHAEGFGVYQFKQGFDAEVVELLGEFQYVAEPFRYQLYSRLSQLKHALFSRHCI